jgi:hypothetical protein
MTSMDQHMTGVRRGKTPRRSDRKTPIFLGSLFGMYLCHFPRCHSRYASLLPIPRSLATFFSAAFSSAFSSAMISRTRWAMLTVSDAGGAAPSSALAISSVISPLMSQRAFSCSRISDARPRRNSSCSFVTSRATTTCRASPRTSTTSASVSSSRWGAS